MNIIHSKTLPLGISEIAKDSAYHVLTDAHVGFSVLHTFAKASNVSTAKIKQFEDEVNRRDEAGTLFPEAHVSAIPKCYTRTEDPAQKQLAVAHIKDFLAENESSIKATKLIFDFQGSLRPDIFNQAIEGFTSSIVTDVYFCYPGAENNTIEV